MILDVPISNRRRDAFTLVEVILAIGIAIGLLVVALYFYSQSADVRARLLQESDRISAIRLYLDRLSADLRAAYAQPQVGFSGEAASLRFVTARVLSQQSWTARPRSGRPTRPQTDLNLVRYGTVRGVEGTNVLVTGLTRTEEPFLEIPRVLNLSNETSAVNLTGTDPSASAQPQIEAIRFVQFSFWDGTGWSDHWDAMGLPGAIEVVLGADPLPSGMDPLDYPFEMFRRVIYLPGSRGADESLDIFAGRLEPGFAAK